ncbi:hypothetical protein ASD02_25160 [Ensifer sp. Root1252]|jgi:hypothetical protein|nr:hypothetical protein ASD02_25160 [Ensifer sp. Root1252]KRC79321.1 hypothetical protein ASE32_25700 [Ensifer sp. Root231]KRC99713.1 hypothetical protein ASE47_26060 [Ensifer sp. Root258]
MRGLFHDRLVTHHTRLLDTLSLNFEERLLRAQLKQSSGALNFLLILNSSASTLERSEGGIAHAIFGENVGKNFSVRR